MAQEKPSPRKSKSSGLLIGGALVLGVGLVTVGYLLGKHSSPAGKDLLFEENPIHVFGEYDGRNTTVTFQIRDKYFGDLKTKYDKLHVIIPEWEFDMEYTLKRGTNWHRKVFVNQAIKAPEKISVSVYGINGEDKKLIYSSSGK